MERDEALAVLRDLREFAYMVGGESGKKDVEAIEWALGQLEQKEPES